MRQLCILSLILFVLALNSCTIGPGHGMSGFMEVKPLIGPYGDLTPDSISHLFCDGTSYVAVLSSGSHLLASTDGRNWRKVSLPGRICSSYNGKIFISKNKGYACITERQSAKESSPYCLMESDNGYDWRIAGPMPPNVREFKELHFCGQNYRMVANAPFSSYQATFAADSFLNWTMVPYGTTLASLGCPETASSPVAPRRGTYSVDDTTLSLNFTRIWEVNGRYYSIDQEGEGKPIRFLYSDDLILWHSGDFKPYPSFYDGLSDLVYGRSGFVASGSHSIIYSQDGISWKIVHELRR